MKAGGDLRSYPSQLLYKITGASESSWGNGWLVAFNADIHSPNSQHVPLIAVKPIAHPVHHHHFLGNEIYSSSFTSLVHVRAIIIKKIYKKRRNGLPHLGPLLWGLLGHHCYQHCLFCFVPCVTIEKDSKTERMW